MAILVKVSRMRHRDPESEQDDRREAAADWFVRLDAGAMSQAELTAFRAWLVSDPANEAAFDEVCDLWGGLEGLRRRLAPAPERKPRRLIRRLAAGASLAAAAIVLLVASDDLTLIWKADFLAGPDVRTIALDDGSRVQLNARAAIAVDYSGQARRLTLLRGQAYFEVAPNPARPFIVEAAGGTTTVRGTAFDIETQDSRTEVTVTDHVVGVSTGDGEEVVVVAGRQTAYGPGFGVQAPYSVDAAAVTAWRRGQMMFQDRPLGEVIAALSRHHRGFVLVLGEALRRRRVSGVFSTADPMAAIRTIALSLGLRTITLTPYLVLLRA
ncbi:FecR family protein [Methylocapsa palsarum]|uniref:Transmembrane sensor n=1 Tax=Methylocapsa palsarum TaxID=1612308 RepID=A0A1I4BN44_9HYPH|nr:FecR domain-containing protein [Methylocapsa palsarum]SFK69406.1 transmembrane sensor [Methylocapsa palsarum]